jgi:FtsH-binding integral membrane protein
MVKVYAWMCFGLIMSALMAMYTANTPALIELIFGNRIVFWAIFGIELLLVYKLSSLSKDLSAVGASLMFTVYAVINGLVLSSIFIVYTIESIVAVFMVTAVTFGIMSLYGYFTKTDLTSMGSFCMMGLIGLMIASIANYFIYSEMIDYIVTYVGVVVFVCYTAYDTQKIKNMNVLGNEGTEEDQKEAIRGALELYLDFVNLFLYLLRIFAKRK